MQVQTVHNFFFLHNLLTRVVHFSCNACDLHIPFYKPQKTFHYSNETSTGRTQYTLQFFPFFEKELLGRHDHLPKYRTIWIWIITEFWNCIAFHWIWILLKLLKISILTCKLISCNSWKSPNLILSTHLVVMI